MNEVNAPFEGHLEADKDKLRTVAEAADAARERAGDATEGAGHWVAKSKAKLGHAAEETAEYVQRKPYQALAIAAGIGFVAGLILKRR